MVVHVAVYALSDIGLVREANEDAWAELSEPYFIVLADGMGGHQAGGVASQITVSEMCRLVKNEWNSEEYSLTKCRSFLEDIVKRVNKKVYDTSQSEACYRGMGTTLCALLIHPKGAAYVHVGDSRIYRYRNYQLEQLTQDHSWIKECRIGSLVDLSAYKHILSRAIGIHSSVEPSVAICPIVEGDYFILCSDGLTDRLTNDEIQAILCENPPDKTVSILVDEAKSRGGQDNITVIGVEIHEAHLS